MREEERGTKHETDERMTSRERGERGGGGVQERRTGEERTGESEREREREQGKAGRRAAGSKFVLSPSNITGACKQERKLFMPSHKRGSKALTETGGWWEEGGGQQRRQVCKITKVCMPSKAGQAGQASKRKIDSRKAQGEDTGATA